MKPLQFCKECYPNHRLAQHVITINFFSRNLFIAVQRWWCQWYNRNLLRFICNIQWLLTKRGVYICLDRSFMHNLHHNFPHRIELMYSTMLDQRVSQTRKFADKIHIYSTIWWNILMEIPISHWPPHICHRFSAFVVQCNVISLIVCHMQWKHGQ